MGAGRMGALIRSTAESMSDDTGAWLFDVVAQVGFDLDAADTAAPADVMIDFSNVATLPAVLSYVQRTGCALVSGTTGYTTEQLAELKELGTRVRVVWSGKYSIGVAALRHLPLPLQQAEIAHKALLALARCGLDWFAQISTL